MLYAFPISLSQSTCTEADSLDLHTIDMIIQISTIYVLLRILFRQTFNKRGNKHERSDVCEKNRWEMVSRQPKKFHAIQVNQK